MEETSNIPENIPEGEALDQAMAAAYRVYQNNVRAASSRIFDLTKGARAGMPEKELLAIAMEALEKCELPADEAEA